MQPAAPARPSNPARSAATPAGTSRHDPDRAGFTRCQPPRSAPISAGARRRLETCERLVLAQQLEALEQARRDLRAGHCEPDRLERLPRLLAEHLGEPAERLLDPPRLPRLDGRERATCGAAGRGVGTVRAD